MIKIQLKSVHIKNAEILTDINLELADGEIVALLGKNGSGKSTLINSITESPVTRVIGDVTMDSPVFVGFQKPVEIPEMSVMDLLRFLERKHRDNDLTPGQLMEKYESIMDELMITPGMLEGKLNVEVSGGENKRLELLQMLIIKPKTILLDEMDTGLDLDAITTVGNVLSWYVKEHKPTVIVVTHNMRFLDYFKVTRVVVLGDKTIKRDGGLELVKELSENGFKNILN